MGKKLERGPRLGKSMTLGELAAFVTEAQDNGHGNAEQVFVRGSWGGGIKSIMVDDEKLVEQTPGPNPDPRTIRPS